MSNLLFPILPHFPHFPQSPIPNLQLQMDLYSLLTNLSHKGVKLSTSEASLEVDAPKGVLTPELCDLLTEHKENILKLLEQNSDAARDISLPKVVSEPESRCEPFPLTDMQHAFWVGRSGVLELGGVSNHGYYEIEGKNLNPEKLNWGLQKLIERHEMLRAIVLPDGQQQILEQVPDYQMQVLDLRGQNQETVDKQLEIIRDRMSHQVLQSDKWPLFEFRVTCLDGEKVRLHVSYDLLVFDAWGLFRLFEEWFQLYQNPDVVLPSLELSFRDYVLADRKIVDTQLYKRSREYWLNRIDSLPSAPELPLAKNPKELKQHHTQRYNGMLQQSEWLSLKQKASQVGLTPTGVLLAAFSEILTLWSKSPQFTLNLALFNRLPLHSQINDILGCFTSVNLLAIDNSIPESFTDRAIRLQKQLWQDLEHRYFNGVRVTRELAKRKGTTPSALPVIFTSTLGFSSLGQETLTFSHFGELVYGISQASQAWMDVQVWEEKETLTFNWDVVEELFPQGTIADMFEAYCQFLKQLANTESAWLETTRQLLPGNQLAQINTINATDAPIPSALLHELFAYQVQVRASETAIISSQDSFTYQELFECSNQVAHRLRKLGVTPNKLVGVVMEKGWEQIIAVMGISISGAAYVPIDPKLPQERFSYFLENSQVDIILTQSWLKDKLPCSEHIQVRLLCVDNQEFVGESKEPLESVQTPDDLAYVIYTSGSTGLPKGVAIAHRAVVNTILDVNQRFGVNSTDRVLALSSLSFDLSVYDIFGTLAAGGTIVVPEAKLEREPENWTRLIAQHDVTVWNSVPALMQMLVDYGTDSREILASLRLVLLSGDWIPLNLPTQIKTLVGDVQVVSLGGATEASIWSIFYPIEEINAAWISIPYGRPMTNQHFYVLNNALEPCPVWVPGQLYISGVGLAACYWRNETKTAASFIKHPITGERLYRTGDLGRYLPDGNIEFIGREDFQVKVGGYRIELGEIEATLLQHQAVDKVVVNAIGERATEKRLFAYVVLEDKCTTTTNELRSFVRDKLPVYMIPSAFIFLDALPLSANGKVDRRALPVQDSLLQQLEVSYVAPETDIEKIITGIWQNLLEVEKVGVNDNFFDLGGNSLIITKAYSELKKKLPKETELILLVDLFDCSTIKSLSKKLSQGKSNDLLNEKEAEIENKFAQGKSRLEQRLKKSKMAHY